MRIVLVGIVLALLGASGTARAEHRATDEVVSTVGYRKGKRVTVRLVAVDWTHLDRAAARDYRAMQTAAAAEGIELFIRSGFRRHERQIALWKAGYDNRAAKPGFSNHQSGRALDLYVRDPVTRTWLEKHAVRYGFRRTVGDEPWHYEHVGRARVVAKARPRKAPARAASMATR